MESACGCCSSVPVCAWRVGAAAECDECCLGFDLQNARSGGPIRIRIIQTQGARGFGMKIVGKGRWDKRAGPSSCQRFKTMLMYKQTYRRRSGSKSQRADEKARQRRRRRELRHHRRSIEWRKESMTRCMQASHQVGRSTDASMVGSALISRCGIAARTGIGQARQRLAQEFACGCVCVPVPSEHHSGQFTRRTQTPPQARQARPASQPAMERRHALYTKRLTQRQKRWQDGQIAFDP
jgi:hypothetical protein